jgi:hypothetical protein
LYVHFILIIKLIFLHKNLYQKEGIVAVPHTGYMIQHGNGGGSKSAHGNTGHHFEPGVGWKYTHGDTGGSPIKEHGKGI